LRTEAGSYRLPDASFYRLPDKMAPSPVDEALPLLGTPARAPSSIRKALSPLGTGRQVKAADHALRTTDGLSVAEMSPSPGEFRGEFRAVTSQIANPSSRWIAPFEEAKNSIRSPCAAPLLRGTHRWASATIITSIA
jgi:hypothetical protein